MCLCVWIRDSHGSFVVVSFVVSLMDLLLFECSSGCVCADVCVFCVHLGVFVRFGFVVTLLCVCTFVCVTASGMCVRVRFVLSHIFVCARLCVFIFVVHNPSGFCA